MEAFLAHADVLLSGARHGGAQSDDEALARHPQQVQRRLPVGVLQERPGPPAELEHLQLFVDDDARRTVMRQHDAITLFLNFRQRGADFGHAEHRRCDWFRVGFLQRRIAKSNHRPGVRGFFDIKLRLLVEQRKQVGEPADGLRSAQEQIPMGFKRVMEQGHDFSLQRGAEIDQHIAATDQVQIRKGRIGHHVLAGENAHLAHRFIDAVAAFGLHEKPPHPLGRHVHLDAIGEYAGAGFVETRVIDIGPEDLYRVLGLLLAHELDQGHRQRIDLLAGGTARHPNADRVLR